MTSQFTNFHTHTDYSLLKSPISIKPLLSKAIKYGYKSIAITELGNMFSAIDFYKSAKDIKPIIGIDAYVDNHRMILIAKDDDGYKNLMYLSSISYLYNSESGIPIIKKEQLIENQKGVAVILNHLESEVGFHLNIYNELNVLKGASGYEKAKKIASNLRQNIEDLYLEIRRDGFKEEEFIENDIINLANELNIPLLASTDVWYLEQTDYMYKDALECIANNKQFDDLHREIKQANNYLKTNKEMLELFSDIPDSIKNTQLLDEKITLKLNLGDPTPPKFKFTKEYAKNEGLDFDNDADYFSYKCRKGLEKKLIHIPQEKHSEYKKRLETEIEIINSMKFPGYMLIVWDFVREAASRTPHIPVGPGRGSAAGSLVAYSLGITNIDPLKYGLLFERFLNPERVSMPDIDMDFCQDKRGDIIEYVRDKYGRENVAQVITFGSLLAKGVLRDMSRIFGIDYSIADNFVKLIPNKLGITLEEAKEEEPKIAKMVQEDGTYNRLYNFGLKLEGKKRNTGMHAAGIVISDNKLWEKTPLYKQDENFVTQYSLNYLEDVDLIKFDFLGLKTLTVIDNALKSIKNNYNKIIDFSTMEMDDKKIFQLISSGKTLGLFQVESDGMQDLNERLKPDCFEDIVAVLALYRPGPMDAGMTEDFVARKNGESEVKYFFDDFEPILKPILENTYGVIVYQEQVMKIVQEIGGFSLGEADIIRRAMGKKNIEYMKQKASEFADGAEKKGLKREDAIELFSLIEKFAGYGFNKSHSAAYAMITYQTAFLKVYYPAEFFSALLSSEKDNTDKIVRYIDELQRINVKLLPPDVENSNDDFTAINGDVIFGLGAIKGVGSKAIESIITNRPFESLEDFILKVDTSKVNKRVIEALIKAGAMDKFEYSRKAMLGQIEDILDYKKRIEDSKNRLKNSLFGDDDFEQEKLHLRNIPEFELLELINNEFDVLGFYVSAHPLDPYKDRFEGISYNLSSEIDELIGSSALFIGKITSIQKRMGKKGKPFGIISFLDFHGKFDFMVFADMLEEIEEMDLNEPIAIKIDISMAGEFKRLNCKKIINLDDAKNEKIAIKTNYKPIQYEIEINEENYEEKLMQIYSKAMKFHGSQKLILIIKTPFGFMLEVDTKMRVGEEFLI